MFLKQIFYVVCILYCTFNAISSNVSKMKVTDKWITDDRDRIRIFHGFNTVQKQYPWYDSKMLNESILKLYSEWGFNAVRLGTMWAGVEPTEGVYNETYLDILEQIVEKFAKYNIYVLLDMHQDVLSTEFGVTSYEGIPRWVVNKFKRAKRPYPWPFRNISDDNWALGYLTEDVSFAFQQLYDNVGGAVDAMGKFWKIIADRFKKHKNVLGYEIINEPWAGDIYNTPTLLEPGVAGSKNLEPLYDKLSLILRSADPNTLIFYEPVTWAIYFNGNNSGTGLSHVPGGKAFANMSVLSYHYYCWLITPDILSNSYGLLLRSICEGLLGIRFMPKILADIARTGGASFMTEFGDCCPDGSEKSINTIECNFVLQLADQYLQSWMYWDNTFVNEDGKFSIDVLNSFVRPFARAIAGVPSKMFYDRLTKEFRLEFVPIDTQTPTKIFVPRFAYPYGFMVKVSSNLKYEYRSGSSSLYIYPLDNQSVSSFVYIHV